MLVEPATSRIGRALVKDDKHPRHWRYSKAVFRPRLHGLTAPWIIDKPMTRAIFEAYVETQLAPTLEHGDVVILDNLPAHKS